MAVSYFDTSFKIISTGLKDGNLSFYNAETGREESMPWHKEKSGIDSPPVSITGEHVYFIAGNYLNAIDSQSKVYRQHKFSGECCGSLAVSDNHIFLSTTDGLYVFSHDLQPIITNKEIHGGFSSPVLNSDGTVYVVDAKFTLWALG